MKINKNLIIGFIVSYILSQIIIYLLSKNNFFKSPMYILLPIFAYFALYLITPAINKYVKSDNIATSIAFLIICVVSFYIALYIFHWNTLGILNNRAIEFNYLKILLDSAFLEFTLAGIIGILFSKK